MLTSSLLQLRRPPAREPSDGGQLSPVSVRPETDRFLQQLDSLLRRLGDLHLRISIARLSLGSTGLPEFQVSQCIADHILDPCAMAGVMPDNCVVAAFLGPRSDAGSVGDNEMTSRIRGHFQQAVCTAGRPGTASTSRLAIVHGWTDQIRDLPAMAHELQVVSPIRLEGPRLV